jgi:hypothetical protein
MVVGCLRMDEVILVCFSEVGLLQGCDPVGVGIQEQEENHAEGHEVHVDQEENATVVEAPAALHTTDRVGRTCDGGERGNDEDRSGMDVREVGEEECCAEAEKDEEAAA